MVPKYSLVMADGVDSQGKAKEPTTPESISKTAKSPEQLRCGCEVVETRLGVDKGTVWKEFSRCCRDDNAAGTGAIGSREVGLPQAMLVLQHCHV